MTRRNHAWTCALALPRSSICLAPGKSNRTFEIPGSEASRFGYPGREPEVFSLKRYYFHLVDGNDVILDEGGVEVADLEIARAEVIKAIVQFRRECPDTAIEWVGWRIEVADAAGSIVLVIDLNDLAEDERDKFLLH